MDLYIDLAESSGLGGAQGRIAPNFMMFDRLSVNNKVVQDPPQAAGFHWLLSLGGGNLAGQQRGVINMRFPESCCE